MLISVFGISIKYEAWNHQDSLPVYIAGRVIFIQHILKTDAVDNATLTEELATLPALKNKL